MQGQMNEGKLRLAQLCLWMMTTGSSGDVDVPDLHRGSSYRLCLYVCVHSDHPLYTGPVDS